jgi:hypothetical protein
MPSANRQTLRDRELVEAALALGPPDVKRP